MSIDWGVGRYESTAERLLPAAREAVAVADPRPGERVVDVGCGTGNAALLAAERGAVVTGVDPAVRLLDVARERARSAGLDVTFVRGEAAALPLPDASADLILSVFAVIFAPDPAAAVAEMSRVLADPGRIVLTAWLPGGALDRMVAVQREATRAALGRPPEAPGMAWHDADRLTELVAGHGFGVSVQERRITITDESPAAYLDGESRQHPMAIAGQQLLGARGELDAVRARMLAVLEEENEDPTAFAATSRYAVLTLRRSGPV